jgi:hypothetical protein
MALQTQVAAVGPVGEAVFLLARDEYAPVLSGRFTSAFGAPFSAAAPQPQEEAGIEPYASIPSPLDMPASGENVDDDHGRGDRAR